METFCTLCLLHLLSTSQLEVAAGRMKKARSEYLAMKTLACRRRRRHFRRLSRASWRESFSKRAPTNRAKRPLGTTKSWRDG